ncbi:MAG: aryl-sulfate sulfotransferase, partial [Polyangiaceae bacterium]
MNQTPIFTLPTYLRAGIFAPFALALMLACGSDIDAPSDPTTTTSGGGGATSGTSANGGEGGSGGSVGTGGDGGEGLCTIPANATVGLLKHTNDSFGGYTLLAPNGSTRSYLLDECGQVVHQWQHGSRPGQSTYLLENGDLLRAEKVGGMTFQAGGSGGRVVRYNWEGDTLWTFAYSTDTYRQHHDVELLPNGNVLLIAWEKKTAAEATAAGRDPSLLAQNELWPDHIIEVVPEGPADGKIVWRWNSWDHLIQDHDPNQANYGAPSEHPELIDINFASSGNADWLHINSIDYNAAHDQIILSAHNLNEVWIIDHSTTSSEAASHQGGNSG